MTRRVVTLPPAMSGDAALAFAARARAAGADLVEIRDDLHTVEQVDVPGMEAVLPVLWARRVLAEVPPVARRVLWVDEPAGQAGSVANLWSFHAPTPMSPADAVAHWKNLSPPSFVSIKHVEPLGELAGAPRLLETQRALSALLGPSRVTVLATGAAALPFRAVLSAANALDYCAMDGTWSAAPGQRLLSDAVRSGRGATTTARLGIMGHAITGSRSPRIHAQPFDRVDLPADVDVPALLDALHPHYRGLAVTSPFKISAARAVRSSLDAINTLVRTRGGWRGHNTDVAGAQACMERAGMKTVVVLGNGGVTQALRQVKGLRVAVHAHADLAHAVLRGDVIWTWPPSVEPPRGLRLEGARVLVLAYGAAGRRVATRVRALGGAPLMMGPCWFIAQAREQARLWRDAT